jgi:hypothetical protein
VRVCKDALFEGTRCLDNGAMGVVVPHVDTAEEAATVARAYRFPPVGERSWGGPPFAYGLHAPNPAEAQAELNREILVACMIETPEAVRNADAIAAVPGVDVLMFGTSDLTATMGIPGQIGHPDVRKAYEAVGAACRTHGKVMGMGGVYDEKVAPGLHRPRRALHPLGQRPFLPDDRRRPAVPLPARPCGTARNASVSCSVATRRARIASTSREGVHVQPLRVAGSAPLCLRDARDPPARPLHQHPPGGRLLGGAGAHRRAEGSSVARFCATLHDEVLARRGEVGNFASLLRVTCLTWLEHRDLHVEELAASVGPPRRRRARCLIAAHRTVTAAR